MGDVQCDILSGDNMCCIFVRFVDTTNQKITSFTSLDNHRDPEIYQKVTHVLFYRGTLPTFPSEMSNFFPNLRFIEIYNCGMKSIYAENLRGFTKLEKLKLDFNAISYLPSNLFEFTPKITQISFVSNNITKIGAEIFDKIDDLIKVDFTRNPKINFRYKKGRHDLNFLKNFIREHCEPLESLKALATETVRKNINDNNYEEVKMIGRHLGINDLFRCDKTTYLQLD